MPIWLSIPCSAVRAAASSITASCICTRSEIWLSSYSIDMSTRTSCVCA